MVKKGIEYFQITLAGSQKTIQIGDKAIPIIGVFLSDDSLHEILSGKKIQKNTKNKKIDKLSYIALDRIPDNKVKELETFIFGLTIKEKMAFSDELSKLEQNLQDEKFLEESYGLGDKMTRRLIINSKKAKEQEQKGQ